MGISNFLKTRIERLEEKKDVDGLIDALYDENDSVRIEAVNALGRIRDPKAVEPLLINFKDKNKELRLKIARSLGEIGDRRAVHPLINALEDGDDQIIEESILSLGKIKDPESVPYLIKELSNKNEIIQADAITALGHIGDSKALEPLSKLVDTENLIDTENGLIRQKVLASLGMITLNPYLTQLNSENEDIRKHALNSMKNIADADLTGEIDLKLPEALQKVNKDVKPSIKVAEKKSSLKEIKDVESDDLEIELDDTITVSKKTYKKDETILSYEKLDLIISEGYYKYIEGFVLRSRYNCLENFVEKINYCINTDELDNLIDLYSSKGIELDKKEMNWLIKEEIKKQEYLNFKTKIEKNRPKTLQQHIKNLLKNYPHNHQKHTKHLQKLLKEKNLLKPDQNLKKEIKNTEKQVKIQEFQKSLKHSEKETKMSENGKPHILIQFKIKDLKEKRDMLVLNGNYKYLENFVKKTFINYKIGELDNLIDLYSSKGIELDKKEMNWLIKEEIKKQEYLNFKTKIEKNRPKTLQQHIKNLLKNYPHNHQKHTKHLQKLLKEKNLLKPDQNLKKEIKNTEKQVKIQEFQNRLNNPHQLIKEMELDFSNNLEKSSKDSNIKSLNLGKLFYDMDILQESLSYYDEVLKVDLNNLDALNWKALALYKLGRSNESASLFNRIIDMNSGYTDAWINLGVILYESGKIREAELSYFSALNRLGTYNRDNIDLNYIIFNINPYARSHFKYFVDLISSDYIKCGTRGNESPVDQAIEKIKKDKYETDLE
ncbi:MAG: HEAT repeat domain-containing protein [Methanomicrobiales archaeon]